MLRHRSLARMVSAIAMGALLAVSSGGGVMGAQRPAVPGMRSQVQTPYYALSDHRHRVRYILEDIETFGGPSSAFFQQEQMLLNGGILVGFADTARKDPNAPVCRADSCYVNHAFLWDGALRDLGALPGKLTSFSNWISARQQIAGDSQVGVIDPGTGQPETLAVLWTNGEGLNLGTLGGNESGATGVNDSGQVTGVASNAVPDPYSFFRNGQQLRAFLWQNGRMHDIGTLGGPDAFGQYINNRGQVAGFSYINNVPGPSGSPTVDPFLWNPGSREMTDLGGFGGTFGAVGGLNDRGQVIGTSNGPDDNSTLPFLWDRGRLVNLGTFGGPFGAPNWINNAGDVVGYALQADGATESAALWRDGAIHNLGTLPGEQCGVAWSINERRQIVGSSFAEPQFCPLYPSETPSDAVLWENGEIVNLNAVISPHASLHLVIAFEIDDRGDIAGLGVPPGVPVSELFKRGHAFVLIPCDERPSTKGCGEPTQSVPVAARMATSVRATRSNSARLLIRTNRVSGLTAIRAFIAHRYHVGGLTP